MADFLKRIFIGNKLNLLHEKQLLIVFCPVSIVYVQLNEQRSLHKHVRNIISKLLKWHRKLDMLDIHQLLALICRCICNVNTMNIEISWTLIVEGRITISMVYFLFKMSLLSVLLMTNKTCFQTLPLSSSKFTYISFSWSDQLALRLFSRPKVQNF